MAFRMMKVERILKVADEVARLELETIREGKGQ